jgi:hypothetical protein
VIVPDVNVLVHAFRVEAAQHEDYAAWLSDLVDGADELGLVDTVLLGFVRVVTSPRIFAEPAPTLSALAFVAGLRAGRRARAVPASDAAWRTMATFASQDRLLRGPLVPDAWLAALADVNNARVATRDRGFARFPGVRSFDPAAETRPAR